LRGQQEPKEALLLDRRSSSLFAIAAPWLCFFLNAQPALKVNVGRITLSSTVDDATPRYKTAPSTFTPTTFNLY
jgi:hypothetical protein